MASKMGIIWRQSHPDVCEYNEQEEQDECENEDSKEAEYGSGHVQRPAPTTLHDEFTFRILRDQHLPLSLCLSQVLVLVRS